MLTSVNRVSDKNSSAHIAPSDYISVFVNGCHHFLTLSESDVLSQPFHQGLKVLREILWIHAVVGACVRTRVFSAKTHVICRTHIQQLLVVTIRLGVPV